MGFIDKGVSMLKAGDALAIHISRAKDNGVSVRIEPRVTLPDAETDDPELARLQVALAMPLVLRFDVATQDIENQIARAIEGMGTARQSTVSAIDAYQEAQAEARNAAALAAKEKASKKPATVKANTATKAAPPTPEADSSAATPQPSDAATLPDATAPAGDSNQRSMFE